MPAFIDKIKSVSELEPSEYCGYNEDTERYGKGEYLARLDFIIDSALLFHYYIPHTNLILNAVS
jgi:hypothetical protein